MEDSKVVFWQKRMKVTEGPHYAACTPIWNCPVCKTDYDPGFCKFVKYCYVCGTRIKDGDAEEVIRGHRSNILPFDDALVDSDIVNEIVKPIEVDIESCTQLEK